MIYAPFFEQTCSFDTANMKEIISGTRSSAPAMNAISKLNLSGIAEILDTLSQYDFLSDIITDDFRISDIEKLYESGELAQNDISEELSALITKKHFSPIAEWDMLKKSKYFNISESY